MSQNRGFTLIEALITATIVALGLVAVASTFSFAVRANLSNRQMAVATAPAYDNDPRLPPVTIYASSNPLTHRQTELIQAAMLVSPHF